MYKVFISDRPLIISEKANLLNGAFMVFNCGKSEMQNAIELLESKKAQGIELIGDEEELWDIFTSHYQIIEAAGGVVKNVGGEMLFILRLGKWDLPKGKIEKGENKQVAAMREVEEECGISELKITNELQPTYHTYELKGKKILKRTYWFEMETNDESIPVPQAEEGIEKVVWVSADEVPVLMENTYNSLREVIGQVL